MARDLLTPVNCTDMATAVAGGLSSAISVAINATNGIYVKTTGQDPTKFVFFVSRNSSECSTLGKIAVVAGSTAGNIDFEPGKYSTLRALNVQVPKTTNFVDKGSTGDGSFNMFAFTVGETARFLDTDNYIKFNFDADMTSATNSCHGAKMWALYLKDM